MNHSPVSRRRTSPWLAGPLVVVALLTGCSGREDAAAPSTEPSATASASPAAEATTAPPAGSSGTTDGDGGPEDAFLTWLAASRKPDAATACAYMTPALQQRMVDEMSATGLPIEDCTGMIEFTAGMYAAAGQSSETAVELVEETDEKAVLHVQYSRDGGSCGSVVLVPGDGHWVLDERSKREC